MGTKELLLWAWEQGMPEHENVCTGAAQAGNLGLLRWLHIEHGFAIDHGAAACAAAEAGDLTILEWMWTDADLR